MSESAFFGTKRVRALYPVPRATSIVTQSENGPCPLLAVVNALLLQSELRVEDLSPEGVGDVGGCALGGLVSAVCAHIDRRAALGSEGGEEAVAANAAAAEARAVAAESASGLDVNVRFDDCERFEFTSTLGFFDACGLRLVHGWVVGREEHGEETAALCGSDGYNRLTERLIDLRTSVEDERAKAGDDARGEVVGASADGDAGEDASERVGDREERELVELAMKLSLGVETTDADEALARAMRDADLIEEFLNVTASQLTATGLAQMQERVREREYWVWFRNNHFSVVTKNEGQLYALVTDQGYLHEPDVVWEGLGGYRDGAFFNSSFEPFEPHVELAADFVASPTARDPLPDAFLRAGDAPTATSMPTDSFGNDLEKSDHAIAMELQAQYEAEDRLRAERERRARAERPAPPTAAPPSRASSSRKKASASSSKFDPSTSCVVS